jgi:hypothetical protein
MKIGLKRFVYLSMFILFITTNPLAFAAKNDPKEFYNSAVDAYIYAYPLVLTDVTKQIMTNVASAETTGRAPINQFSHAMQLAKPNDKDVVLPNVDTLYSIAWLDLTSEPLILSVPDTKERFYLLPMLDAWSDVFASPGKRTTGTQAGTFVIVGPNWSGELPPNIPVIRAATNLAWIIGRTLVSNTKEDLELAHAIQKAYTLTPLSKWGTEYTPPSNLPVDPSIDMTTPPLKQTNNIDGVTFFKRFAHLLKTNPPHAGDYQTSIINELKVIGIEPGNEFDTSALSPDQINMLNLAAKTALGQIVAFIPKLGGAENSWLQANIIGQYGTAYLNRASMAYLGLGANIPDDAVYLRAMTDGSNVILNGANQYTIHFSSGNIPQVNGFWSVTLYNNDGYLTENSIDRYTLGDRSNLQFNADGSLDMYLQHNSPGVDKESNWLPIPETDFNLLMRLYWKTTNGNSWTPPVITTNSSQSKR